MAREPDPLSLWILIERILIPNGFFMWRFQGFFLYSILILLSELYSFGRSLVSLLSIIFHPLKFIFHVIWSWTSIFVLVVELDEISFEGINLYEALEESQVCGDIETHDPVLFNCDRVSPVADRLITVFEYETNGSRKGRDGEDKGVLSVAFVDEGQGLEEFFSLRYDNVFPILDNGGREQEELEEWNPELPIPQLRESEEGEGGYEDKEELVVSVDEGQYTGSFFSFLEYDNVLPLLDLRGSERGEQEELDGFNSLPLSLQVRESEESEEHDGCDSAFILQTQGSERGAEEELPDSCDASLPILRVRGNAGGEEELDGFYKEYMQRMLWFDQLNYDRTCGVNAILNIEMSDPRLFGNIEIMISSLTGASSKKLSRSIQSDFELIYVGQSCLAWEALHHHYRRVEAVACSSDGERGAFHGNVAGNLQHFQILIERFMENEIHVRNRYWNYTQNRLYTRNFLQVPDVSGFLEEASNELREETTNTKEMLEAIEKAIEAFWVFIQTDNNKSSGKLKKLLWIDSRVEDPNDLELLEKLTKEVQKKDTGLKDLRRTRRQWWKRTRPLEVPDMMEILFSMIDTRLVSRVLQMSVISSHQLKWCQEKLSSIELGKGTLTRRTGNGCLFPFS